MIDLRTSYFHHAQLYLASIQLLANLLIVKKYQLSLKDSKKQKKEKKKELKCLAE